MGIEEAGKLPWWFVYIFSLQKRFEAIQSWSDMAVDGKAPSRSIWMDDIELEAWRDSQESLRREQKNHE